MKKTSKKFLQSSPDCCNLQSDCKQMSLIYKDYMEISRLQIPDCKKPLQSGIPHKETISYKTFQIARSVYHTFGMGWCANCASLFAHHQMFVFVAASEVV